MTPSPTTPEREAVARLEAYATCLDGPSQMLPTAAVFEAYAQSPTDKAHALAADIRLAAAALANNPAA